jgi:hypothetical protein
MVKTILKYYTNVRIKSSRFWDDQLVRVVAGKILYAIHHYCPGIQVNLEQERLDMSMNPWIHTELVTDPPVTADKKEIPQYNMNASIEKMVSLKILTDNRTAATVQEFIPRHLTADDRKISFSN